MPQPDALQISKGKVCGQQKHVDPTPLKHWLPRVCEVVGLTFSLRPLQSYCHLKQFKWMSRQCQQSTDRPFCVCES